MSTKIIEEYRAARVVHEDKLKTFEDDLATRKQRITDANCDKEEALTKREAIIKRRPDLENDLRRAIASYDDSAEKKITGELRIIDKQAAEADAVIKKCEIRIQENSYTAAPENGIKNEKRIIASLTFFIDFAPKLNEISADIATILPGARQAASEGNCGAFHAMMPRQPIKIEFSEVSEIEKNNFVLKTTPISI